MGRLVKNIDKKWKVGWVKGQGEYWMHVRCDKSTKGHLIIVGVVTSRMNAKYIVVEGRTWAEFPISAMRAALIEPRKLERLWAIADFYNGEIPPTEILQELSKY